MKPAFKPIKQQVIVIIGASSGIGLATAQLAAQKGASVVLAARSQTTLEGIAAAIEQAGGSAIAVACDVGSADQIQRVADAAIDRFGRIDTWVNDAGISIYGRLDQVTEADSRRLFDTNFWGVVNGSLIALPHLKRSRGTLINVGSEVSEMGVPLLGMYSASKHAVKGFTDSLRIEVEIVDKSPVSITLIQPTAVDTPLPQHGRNYMDKEPKLPTPMIEPDQVAQAILKAAVTHTRDVKVGAKATINTVVAKFLPPLGDRGAAKEVNRMQYDEPPRHPEGALHEPSETTREVGKTRGSGGKVKK